MVVAVVAASVSAALVAASVVVAPVVAVLAAVAVALVAAVVAVLVVAVAVALVAAVVAVLVAAVAVAVVAPVVVVLVFKLSYPIFSSLSRFSMSTSTFSLRTSALLLAGVILVPAAAFAQQDPIVPSSGPVAVPSAPTSLPSMSATYAGSSPYTLVAPAPVIDSMSFRDVDVVTLLSMISGQFNVPIAISGDVSGKIGYINIASKTPEQAIQLVVRAAGNGLKLQQDADGTYIVGRNLTPDAPVQTVDAIVAKPNGNATMNPLPPWGLNPANTGSNPGLGALPQLGAAWGRAPEATLLPPVDEEGLVAANQDQTKRSYTVRTRNVKPSLMAYWLDPANHEEPVEVRANKGNEDQYQEKPLLGAVLGAPGNGQTNNNSSLSGINTQGLVPNQFNNGNPYLNQNDGTEFRSNAQFGRPGGQGGQNGGGRGGANGNGVFQLPTGVDRIIAVDPQNALLVQGTAEGLANLRTIIGFLDRPLRQVEIEAQFVSITTNATAAFGIDFTTARGNFNSNSFGLQPPVGGTVGGIQVGFVRGNFQASLAALQAANRAKILTAPRVTAINNLTATLSQTLSQPIQLTTTVSNNNLGGNQTATNNSIFYINTSISLTVTPTINNDNTITVLMTPQLSTSTFGAGATAPTVTQQRLVTIANVEDGGTLALGGLKTKSISVGGTRIPILGDIPLLGKLFRSRNSGETEGELIIFLTARIVRRQGDTNIVEGT